jgi:hypothetical protein
MLHEAVVPPLKPVQVQVVVVPLSDVDDAVPPEQTPAGVLHEPLIGTVHEAVAPPKLPVQLHVPADAVYPEAVPVVQVSAVLPQMPATEPVVQEAVAPPLRPRQLHVPAEALYPEVVPAVQAPVLPQTPGIAMVQEAVLPLLRPRQLHVPAEAL